ncbi:MAG: hypothetical protein PVG19_11415, partial [Desulfobacterales bacterium]
MLADFAEQGAAIDPQNAGDPGSMPLILSEHPEQVLPFELRHDIGQRFVRGWNGRRNGRPGFRISGGWVVIGFDGVQGDIAVNRVLELADIARPVAILHAAHHVFGHHRHRITFAELLQKVLDQGDNIFAAF